MTVPLQGNQPLRDILLELAAFFRDVASYQHDESKCQQEDHRECERMVLFRMAAYGTNEWARYAMLVMSGAPPTVMDAMDVEILKNLQTLRSKVAASNASASH